MSKKRKREPEPTQLTLAGIYENLANENEDQRLQAARSLLTEFAPKSTSIDQIKVIVRRLFRGLCSSRKAARLGFSVALTEFLRELSVQRGASIGNGLPASAVIDILDNETTPEGNNSGQDERDHYFGRLFGAEAVIKSHIIIKQQDLLQWRRLLDLICIIAQKKPWLKKECGWILYNCIMSFAESESDGSDDFALEVVDRLTAHKLIRTPEGLAIWLEVTKAFPHAKLPKDVWKHRDPLSKKDISLLADVLKDAKIRSNSDEEEHKSQGKAVWSAQLHFAWDVVLQQLYDHSSMDDKSNGKAIKGDHKVVSFNGFWATAVEESLFISTSSAERKHWGLLLFAKVLTDSPRSLLADIFTKNSMSCLINALKGEDRYLQRTAQKAMQSLQQRVDSDPESVTILLDRLLQGINFVDFDALTKTKTIERMITSRAPGVQKCVLKTMKRLLKVPGSEISQIATNRRKLILAYQGKILAQCFSYLSEHHEIAEESAGRNESEPMDILSGWVDAACFIHPDYQPEISEETREAVKAKLSTHLEQALKTGEAGKIVLRTIISDIYVRWTNSNQPVIAFDHKIKQILDLGWERFLSFTAAESLAPIPVTLQNEEKLPPFRQGLLLLYCVLLFQIYTGDAEAVEILQELITYHDDRAGKRKTINPRVDDDKADALIEILLSFASKPSKFLRRATAIIFEGICPQLTNEGLESLIRILNTKESAEGQNEMFEAVDVNEDSHERSEADASDVEIFDSDVEIVSVSQSSSDSEEGDESTDGEKSEMDADDDDELAAFDAKLAAALGTRKLTNGVDHDDDSTTSGASDTDMDDDQMIVLDEKLAEVFRARQKETSRKQERKDAKENIINFKNRVLDLIEIYLKVEYQASQSLGLLLPLLHLARTTKTKQLADRSCSILNDFCKRCKGVNVPACNNVAVGLELLLNLHAEAGLGASNAHANAASHASILVVKSLVNNGVKIGRIVDVYAETQKRMLTEKKCKVQAGLFTDWNNWCISVRERFAE